MPPSLRLFFLKSDYRVRNKNASSPSKRSMRDFCQLDVGRAHVTYADTSMSCTSLIASIFHLLGMRKPISTLFSDSPLFYNG